MGKVLGSSTQLCRYGIGSELAFVGCNTYIVKALLPTPLTMFFVFGVSVAQFVKQSSIYPRISGSTSGSWLNVEVSLVT